MTLSRRHFLERAGAVTLGLAGLRTGIANGNVLRAASGAPGAGSAADIYGPLIADPNKLFDLPKGFSYTVLSRYGQEMDDGLLVPGRHDGMAAFPREDGKTILICNHELELPAHGPIGPFGKKEERLDRLKPGHRYDSGPYAQGGTSTMIYDTRTRTLEKKFMSLLGTVRNCAGGPTPWGSWLTCEETAVLKGDRGDDGKGLADGYLQNHGYVFEVPAAATSIVADPKPIKAMGRFRHEAICIEPRSGVVYLTEDMGDGLIYRYIPNQPGNMLAGGKLQALKAKATTSLCTRNWKDSPVTIAPGVKIPVEWIDLEDIDSPKDDLRARGFAAGAARFARGEGMWFGEGATKDPGGAAYWACTNGGAKQLGQIWRYVPSPHEGTAREKDHPGTLELFVESRDTKAIANADNLCVAPWGGLFVCEDSGMDVQRLMGVTRTGECFAFGSNAGSGSELAGVTASPDGTTLFVNIQNPGTTIAIHGPFKRI